MIIQDSFDKQFNTIYYHNNDSVYPLFRIDRNNTVSIEYAPLNGFFIPTYTEFWEPLPTFNNKMQAVKFIKNHYNEIY